LLEKREEIREKGKTIPTAMEYLSFTFTLHPSPFTLHPSPFTAQV